MNFFQKLMRGETRASEIHNHISEWHKGRSQQHLHEYLGMRKSEFADWVELNCTLETLVRRRTEGKPLSEMSNLELLAQLPWSANDELVAEISSRMCVEHVEESPASLSNEKEQP